MKALITRKVGMTTIVSDEGDLLPVTLLSASPNVVTQVKTVDTDGYQAIQLGFETANKLGKAQAGHFAKSKATPKVVKEIRTDEETELELGNQVSADVFVVGDMVDVTGTSKGKGFAGGIKRHNFARGRKTHGGRSYRRPGSIGSMYPQKIFKGKRMAGHMGNEQVTVKNLKVALVDTELNVIGVVGAVPGPRKSVVVVKGAK
ncbi:50S ribosomal protein L3 [Candidatus Saccharibacteria bacterium]|nr:50S ribosomal protein L3 [Candidatus Saccharibacteria bacterium]